MLFIYIRIHIQVTGYPRPCSSTLLGIIREISQLNGIKHTQKDIMCSSESCQSVTINYNVFNIDPQLKYIFIVDILDYFNNSKTKNESCFSEFKLI